MNTLPSHSRRTAQFLVPAAALLLAGCSLLPGLQPVAEVGNRKLSGPEFQRLLGVARGGPAGPDSLERRNRVQDWVDRTLFVLDAEAMKLDTTRAVRNDLDDQAQQLMAETYYKKQVIAKVKVAPADVKMLYDRRGVAWELAHITVMHPTQAEAVSTALKAGRTFEELARTYSQDGMTAPGGGLLQGSIVPGDLPLPLDSAVAALKPGGVAGPVPLSNTIEFVKLVAVHPNPRGKFEEEKSQLEQLLRRSRLQAATMREMGRLRSSHRFVIQENDLTPFLARMSSAPGDTIPALNPAEQQAPLARFEGGPYTWADCLRDVTRSSGGMRPNLSDPFQVRQYVENQAAYWMMVQEARKQQMERDPKVQETLRNRRDAVLLRARLFDLVRGLPAPTEADLHAAYDKHKAEFVNGGQVECEAIYCADAKTAAEASREARANVDFASIQRRFSKPTAEEARAEGRMRVLFDGTTPVLEDSLRARTRGEVVGPVPARGRPLVLRVMESYPPLNRPFDQARAQLETRVRSDIQQERIRNLLAELRKKWPPVIHNGPLYGLKPAKAEASPQEQMN